MVYSYMYEYVHTPHRKRHTTCTVYSCSYSTIVPLILLLQAISQTYIHGTQDVNVHGLLFHFNLLPQTHLAAVPVHVSAVAAALDRPHLLSCCVPWQQHRRRQTLHRRSPETRRQGKVPRLVEPCASYMYRLRTSPTVCREVAADQFAGVIVPELHRNASQISSPLAFTVAVQSSLVPMPELGAVRRRGLRKPTRRLKGC